MSYGLQVCSDAEVGSSQSSYSCTPKIICDLYHVHYIKETTFIYIHIYVLYVIYVLSSGTNSQKFGAQNSGNKRKKAIFRRLSRLQACFQIQLFLFGECHGYKPVSKIYDIRSSIHFCFSGFLLSGPSEVLAHLSCLPWQTKLSFSVLCQRIQS